MADFTFTPLTPISFLDRATSAFAGRVAIIDGDLRFTYRELAERSARLTSALARAKIDRNDRVAALCVNSHVMLEMHQAVPARGAVLVPLNIRLSEPEMEYILRHSGTKLIVATAELADLGRSLGASVGIRVVIAGGDDDDYEDFLAFVEPDVDDRAVENERQMLAINYTSGTTGTPKGVMYHHRGAYLQSAAMAYHGGLGTSTRYLWTLPMFHCHGWCFTWAVTASGGTHICLRAMDTDDIWRLLREERVTNFSAAPTVLTMIAESPAARSEKRRIHVDTGGAPPSPALLERLDSLGLDVTHLYGLTETFGPVAVNERQPEWSDLDTDKYVALQARQGVGNIISSPLRVLDGNGLDVPADGQTIGEIAVRGNNVMLGYYRDVEATAAATRAGCFLTGDLAVMHPGGYVEIRDRAKDIIISGGENIASIEIEQALDSHPDVLESAVIGVADEKWGETMVAFVTRRAGSTVDQSALIDFMRTKLGGFKVPRTITFTELPKTSTGKIQKNVLRDRSKLRRDAFPVA